MKTKSYTIAASILFLLAAGCFLGTFFSGQTIWLIIAIFLLAAANIFSSMAKKNRR